MRFNPEINLGTLLELALFIIAVAGGIMKFSRIETKLNIMFEWFQRTIIGRVGIDEDDIRKFHGGK